MVLHFFFFFVLLVYILYLLFLYPEFGSFLFLEESCLTHFLVESDLEDDGCAFNMAYWCGVLQRVLLYFLLIDNLHAYTLVSSKLKNKNQKKK